MLSKPSFEWYRSLDERLRHTKMEWVTLTSCIKMKREIKHQQHCVHVLCKLQGECIENTVNIQLARIKGGSGFDLDTIKLNVAFPGMFAVWFRGFHVRVEIIWIIHDNQESKVNFLHCSETENRKYTLDVLFSLCIAAAITVGENKGQIILLVSFH